MTILKAFRLPTVLADKLAKLAQQTHRTEKFYVVQALEQYLDEYVDAQIAKDRFDDPSSKILSGNELKKKLDV